MSLATLLLLTLVAAPLVILAALHWRRELLYLLPVLSVLNGLPITVRGSSVRIDQLVACLLVVPLSASILTGARRLRIDATTLWLAALLALNITASALNSPVPSYSFAQCANLASAWIIYVVLVNFLDTRAEREAFMNRCLWAALIASSIGIVAFVFAMVGVPIGGAEVSSSAAEQFTKAFGASGTMVEPNVFGSFTASYAVLSVALLAMMPRSHANAASVRLLRWTAALTATGLVLSFTRSAWLGAAGGLAVAWLMGWRVLAIRRQRLLIPLAIAGIAVLVLVLLPGVAGAFIRFKLANLVNVESRTATLRLFMYSLALQQSLQHPLIGFGTFTFAPLMAQGSDFARFEGWRNLWIGNYLVLALHDTGVLGLSSWIGLLWSVISGGLHTARRFTADAAEMSGPVVALTAAVTCLLIAFLATSGFSLGYPWLLIGLLGAHGRLTPDQPGAGT